MKNSGTSDEIRKEPYHPGFFCRFFWVLTWLGMLAGTAAVFVDSKNPVLWASLGFSSAVLSAVISYLIRTIEKSRHDGAFSFHVND